MNDVVAGIPHTLTALLLITRPHETEGDGRGPTVEKLQNLTHNLPEQSERHNNRALAVRFDLNWVDLPSSRIRQELALLGLDCFLESVFCPLSFYFLISRTSASPPPLSSFHSTGHQRDRSGVKLNWCEFGLVSFLWSIGDRRCSGIFGKPQIVQFEVRGVACSRSHSAASPHHKAGTCTLSLTRRSRTRASPDRPLHVPKHRSLLFKCALFKQRWSLFRSKTAEWTSALRAAAVDIPHKTSRTLAASVQGPEMFPAFCGAAVCGSRAEFLLPMLYRILHPCREMYSPNAGARRALGLRRKTNLTCWGKKEHLWASWKKTL